MLRSNAGVSFSYAISISRSRLNTRLAWVTSAWSSLNSPLVSVHGGDKTGHWSVGDVLMGAV